MAETSTIDMKGGRMGRLRQSAPYRLRAAGIHFSLSLVVFVVAMYLMLVHWYPRFHFGVDGGWQGTRIMAGVDLVLGPMLTLIIFNPFKARRLIAFDLACIAVIQVAALIWGFYAIEKQRPVSMNFHGNLFYAMTAQPLQAAQADPGLLARLSDRHPALVYVADPSSADESRRAHQRQVDGGFMSHEDPAFFRPLASHWSEIQEYAIDPTQRKDPLLARDLPRFLERHGGQAADYRFFRYQASYGSCFLVFTAAGSLVDAIACERF